MGVAPRMPGGGKLQRKTLGSLYTGQFYGTHSTTFNVSDLPGYKKFTTDNFALGGVKVWGKNGWTQFDYSISYNASTGVVTVKNTVSTDANGGYHDHYGTVTCYCYYIK